MAYNQNRNNFNNYNQGINNFSNNQKNNKNNYIDHNLTSFTSPQNSIKRISSNQPRQINQKNRIIGILQTQNSIKINQFKQQLSYLQNLQTIYFQDQSKYVGQVILVDQDHQFHQGNAKLVNSSQKQNAKYLRNGVGYFQTSIGDIYLGDWINDMYHGYGVYILNDGERYEGQLSYGEKNGHGIYYYKNGSVYDGEWIDGVRQGQGIQTLPNGIQYEGEWQNDSKHGNGKLKIQKIDQQNNNQLSFNNDTSHTLPSFLLTGIWQRNEFLTGKLITHNYQGEYSNRNFNGQGTYKFSDGSIYQGTFINGQIHGQGIYHYSNGDIYQGQFFKSLKHGTGIYKYLNGDIYQGQYYKDLKSGEGKLILSNGHQYIGQWDKDLFNGKGKYFFNKEEFLAGFFENGKISENSAYQKYIVENVNGNNVIESQRKINTSSKLTNNQYQGSKTSRQMFSKSPVIRMHSPSAQQLHSPRNLVNPLTSKALFKTSNSPINSHNKNKLTKQILISNQKYFRKDHQSLLQNNQNSNLRNLDKVNSPKNIFQQQNYNFQNSNYQYTNQYQTKKGSKYQNHSNSSPYFNKINHSIQMNNQSQIKNQQENIKNNNINKSNQNFNKNNNNQQNNSLYFFMNNEQKQKGINSTTSDNSPSIQNNKFKYEQNSFIDTNRIQFSNIKQRPTDQNQQKSQSMANIQTTVSNKKNKRRFQQF